MPDVAGKAVLRAEFAVSAALAAFGFVIWRRAVGKPWLATYVVVISCALLAVFGVFWMYDWIHL